MLFTDIWNEKSWQLELQGGQTATVVPAPQKVSMERSNGGVTGMAAHQVGSWVRLKFLPVDWAVNTKYGTTQIDELLKTSCGLEACHIDIKSGYKHQHGGSGPSYAYAFIQVAHVEDAITVVSRMSVQVLHGMKVMAALHRPGHPGGHSMGGPMAAVLQMQPEQPQVQVRQEGPQGEVDLPRPSGLTMGNPEAGIQMEHRTRQRKIKGCM